MRWWENRVPQSKHGMSQRAPQPKNDDIVEGRQAILGIEPK
jgi:hypothetical protein